VGKEGKKDRTIFLDTEKEKKNRVCKDHPKKSPKSSAKTSKAVPVKRKG